MAPGGELGVDRQLDRPQVKLLEPADLGRREWLRGDVGERGSAPELERGAGQAVCPDARRLASGLVQQLLEAQGVDRAGGHGSYPRPRVRISASARPSPRALRRCETCCWMFLAALAGGSSPQSASISSSALSVVLA